jgi:AcrR family transcriptional regulator
VFQWHDSAVDRSNSTAIPEAPTGAVPSARQRELLEAAYAYVLEHGLSGLSLRPLSSAIGSSPRVLLFLFGSKDGLVRALLARARADELEALDRARASASSDAAAEVVWNWLAAPEHRGLLKLWTDAYTRSLVEPDGPWDEFAAQTVQDWLGVLAGTHRDRDTVGDTLLLAVLRGALLDLLATGDARRTTAAVRRHLTQS